MTQFICDVDERYHSACEGLDFYAEHRGKQYCVLHFPSEYKVDEFSKVKERKLAQQDYDFSGTVFPKDTSDFRGFQFDADVRFLGATFRGEQIFTGAQFRGRVTIFRDAQFSGELTDFSGAKFSRGRTHFVGAEFSGEETSFLNVKFRGRQSNFSDAEFSSTETLFQEATFTGEVSFTRVTFRDRVAFRGTLVNPVFSSQTWAKFEDSRIEKPEQLTFSTVLLHPGWFINADVRKVVFTNVKWYGMPSGPKGTLGEENGALTKRDVESPHPLLAQACRRLSANAEENREYPLANEFHYWSMDALRKQDWRSLGLIGTLYWALSGYGVRARRALGVLLTIAVVFAVLYMLLGPNALQVSSASNPVQVMKHAGQAVVYSLSTMARLNPEPKPNPGLFQFLVTIEGILGPLQIALLALAVRRKVMR